MKKIYLNLLSCAFFTALLFPVKTQAQAGAALNFDGANDQVNVPNSASLNITGNITLEAWVYATKNSGVQNTMCKSSNVQNTGYIFPRTDDGWNNFIVYLHIAGGWKTLSAPYGTLNSWHHLAATWDGTNIRLYKDGALVATSVNYSGLITSNTNQITIGSQPGYGEYFGGSLDEGRIWNVARTKCEINTYKDCEIANNAPGLVANYHFNEGVAAASNGTATALPDATSNANNGALASFALSGATSNWITPGGVVSGSVTPLALNVGYTATTSTLVCNSGTVALSGTGANTYAWTGGITDGVAFPISSTTSYTVTGTNTVTSCSNSAVATIAVGTTPTLVVNSGTVCSGTSFTINPTGASSYTITGGSNVVTPIMSTTYYVTGSDPLGCMSLVDSSIVTVDSVPMISVNSGAICNGSSFTMIPAGAATYTFSGGSAVVSPTTNTSYSVTGTGSNGCVSIAAAVSNITVNALPTILASSSSSLLCIGQTATLTAGGASSYTWNPGGSGTSIAVSPSINTTYSLYGTDSNGCMDSTAFTQNVSTCTSISEVFNTIQFSVYPNPGHGEFTITVADLSSSPIVQVYDNLGKIVYEQKMVFEKQVIRPELVQGIYFLKLIENGKVVSTQKLINN